MTIHTLARPPPPTYTGFDGIIVILQNGQNTMKIHDIPSHNTYTTMRDVLSVLGISSKRYTNTQRPTLQRSPRLITFERIMCETPRRDNETASTYVSRIDAMVDSMIDERD